MKEMPLPFWTAVAQPWTNVLQPWNNVLTTWPALTQGAPHPAPSTAGESKSGDVAAPNGGHAATPANAYAEYLVDSMQRTILFWDVLRKRGNQALEHRASGKPPVLRFAYDVVIDGKTLERPCNYQSGRVRTSC